MLELDGHSQDFVYALNSADGLIIAQKQEVLSWTSADSKPQATGP